jgi:hypothetical protein
MTPPRIDKPRRNRRIKVVIVDLYVATAVVLLIGVIAPDDGPSADSLVQGLIFGVIFSAAPIAALTRGIDSATVMALGGGMVVAGAASTPGANLLGPVMALCGVLLMVAGGTDEPWRRMRMIVMTLVYGLVLSVAMWLAVGTMAMSGLPSLILAIAIATSTRWKVMWE